MRLMKKRNNIFDSKVVNKPWGYEYVIFKIKKKIGITFLNINPKKETSLHAHSAKKTAFIILNGDAHVQIGLYKKNTFKTKTLSRQVFRKGLFHKLSNRSNKPIQALEFETPYDKLDLIRIKDKYGRKKKPYENREKMYEKNGNFIEFNKPKKNHQNVYFFSNTAIILRYISTHKNLNLKDKNSSVALLEGKVLDNKNRSVIGVGEVVKTQTLKILMKNFKYRGKILVLIATKKKFFKNES